MQEIRDLLVDRASINADGQVFFRQRVIDDIFTQDRVVEALKEIELAPQVRNETISSILQSAQLVFAILIRIGKMGEIVHFLELDISDGKLPLFKGVYQNIPAGFYVAQREFLPVKFKRRRVPMRLERHAIIPFLVNSSITKGGYGQVYRVVIPAEHQELVACDNEQEVVLCRKRLEPSSDNMLDDRLFRDEDRILKMLSALQNPNIVQVLVSYCHDGVYNFIFPLADMSLENFLTAPGSVPGFESSLNYIKALAGLAGALHEVHMFQAKEFKEEMIGCHHDIKPQNVLVAGPRFLLADFGLSRLKPTEQDSKSIFKAQGDYIAPECRDARYVRQHIGRKSDIWSLFCVISEVAMHIVSKADGVREFRDVRRTVDGPWTDSHFHQDGLLKEHVRTSMQLVIRKLPDALESQLLRFCLHSLQADPKLRPSAANVAHFLRWMHVESLFERSSKLFRNLVTSRQDSFLLVEEAKFISWGRTYDISQKSFPDYLATQPLVMLTELKIDILEQIHLALLSISQQECTDSSLTSITSKENEYDVISIHYLNEKLLQDMPIADKQEFDHLLFRHFTQANSTEKIDEVQEISSASPETREVGALLALKALSLRSASTTTISEFPKALDAESVELCEVFGNHTLGEYKSPLNQVEQILVEWRSCNRITNQVTLHRGMSEVQKLSNLASSYQRPAVFQVLECIGFFVKSGRNAFGMVYRFPKEDPNLDTFYIRPLSLRTLLTSTKDLRQGGPVLGDRFSMATAIADCIHCIHTVGWYHKNITSQNIIFFQPQQGSAKWLKRFSTPFVIGFNYSRQSTETEASTDTDPEETAYQHPAYRLEKARSTPDTPLFQKSYDYYSVGVVLLEIGLWRALASLLKKHPDLNHESIKELLLEQYVPSLAYFMGEKYRDAVKHCLEYSFCADDSALPAPESVFKTLVVDLLHKCSA